jgi:hypothetical protein
MFCMEKIQEQNILIIRPLFGHFRENSAKILPQICTVAYCTFLLGPFWVMRPKNRSAGNTSEIIYRVHHRRTCYVANSLQRFPDSFDQKFRSLRKMFPGKNFVKKLYLYLK